jgi:hypothetical protein
LRKKAGILILSTFFIFILIVFGVWSIEKKFDEPYKLVEHFVQDAKSNAERSYLLMGEQSWDSIKDKSAFKFVRKELDWNDFKSKIQGKDVSSINIGTKYSLFYKLSNIKNVSRRVDIFTYDSMGTEKNFIPLLLEQVDENWVVVGIGK